MKERSFEESKPTRRELLRDLATFGIGLVGVAVGKAISDAQYASKKEEMDNLARRQQALERSVALDKQQQADVNNILVNSVYRMGKEMGK